MMLRTSDSVLSDLSWRAERSWYLQGAGWSWSQLHAGAFFAVLLLDPRIQTVSC